MEVAEVSKRTGISKSLLRHYVMIGAIVPETEGRSGHRKPWLFSERNLIEVVLMRALVKKFSISLEVCASVMEYLRVDKNEHAFYEDSEWGNDKELLLIVPLGGPPLTPQIFRPTCRNKEGVLHMPETKTVGAWFELGWGLKVVPLGKLKLQAMVGLGLF